jgi:TetR/AcrR family transcriptional repressor of nem operon
MARPTRDKNSKPAKEKLIEAAFTLIRTKGFSPTTVDEICELAGVTKGTFFHYFESKEALAVSAAENWSSITGELFKSAPYHKHKDPLDRFLGYIDFRKNILKGSTSEFTCLVGTMVQETHRSNPKIREACHLSIFGHSKTLEDDIRQAQKLYAPKSKWSAKSLALHTQAVLQGAFILAKASQDPKDALDSLDHLKNYVQLLFKAANHKEKGDLSV